ncbi:MAG: efflux RND transporter periplasmic adaptor subunit [Candidatus Omnitrophota bacterium]|nr:MAG: efflux RND transporter periplasmic adaptor subunit [Candidatus Omnitrophota bacterium]
MKKIMTILIVLVVGATVVALQINRQKSRKEAASGGSQHVAGHEAQILYYTCGMHPSVRVNPADYEKGNKNCPICQMALIPVYSPQKGEQKSVPEIDVISIPSKDLSLAEIETFQVRILPLFKEIRTVGIVVYDPQLRTAEEEYIQTLNTYQKVSQSGFGDAQGRAKEMVEATKIKLELLGLDEESIKELEKRGSPEKSLILPDKFMWVNADFYEYEATWPQIGDKVSIVSEAEPSLVLEGEIKSIEPVIKEKTRTLRARIFVENEGNILKPNMYVDVNLKSDMGLVLSIPRFAVLDTGKRKIAYVDLGNGKFQLREVIVGPLARGVVDNVKMDFYPLIEGVKEAESVVTKGNFLIDSQSQLGAAASGYGGALGKEEAPPVHQH